MFIYHSNQDANKAANVSEARLETLLETRSVGTMLSVGTMA